MSKFNITLHFSLILTAWIFVTSNAFAQSAPKVGRNAAAKYFQKNGVAQNREVEDLTSANQRYPSSIEALGSQDHYLALGIGSFTSSAAYNWGNGSKQSDISKMGFDLTYRLTPDSQLYDQIIRVSYNTYEPLGDSSSKMSFLYGITFPDAGSQFPLYFGLLAGPGIFFKQLDGESSLSLDYQMILGLRLFNLFETAGFFIEGGLRNHLQLTSDGQLNGTFVSAGAVFTF